MRGHIRESMGRVQCASIADKKAEPPVLCKMPAATMVRGRLSCRGWTIDLVCFLRATWTIDLLSIPRYFLPRMGGGFRENKKIFFENCIYVTKIPTKSIFNFGKRKKRLRHKISTSNDYFFFCFLAASFSCSARERSSSLRQQRNQSPST